MCTLCCYTLYKNSINIHYTVVLTFYLYFQNQLQGFLLFLLKCECGRTINSLNDIEPPGWWPSEVSFVDDLLEKSTKKGVS